MNFKRRIRALSLLPLFFICSQIFLITEAFNISRIFISSTAINTEPPPLPPSSQLLQDVLEAIAVKQSWKLEDVRVSKVRNSRFANSQKYEFRVRMEKSILLFRFSDEVKVWKRLGKKSKFGNLLSEISGKQVLRKLQLDGPFELRVDGEDEMKLKLPMNSTHSGLKRLIVDEGITVLVEGAQQIFLSHLSNFGLPINNKSSVINEKRNPYFPYRPSLCTPLPPVQIIGSASLLAFNTHDPNVHIKTTFLSPNILKLLPENGYTEAYYKRQTCPIRALNKKLDLLKKLVKILPDERTIKVNITTSTLVRFEVELERDIREDETFSGSLAEWRTKPEEERVSYEVLARVEGERLKPIVVKKIRPFIAVDSTAWSTLMSNISFTKFPSVVGPPETLTLDVKW